MKDSQELLAEYAQTGSEPAFRELVRRYIDLVYFTAVRQVEGDTHLAEDVVQTVFVHFARKACRLSPAVMLGGWFHRATCHVAATVLRGERRRRARERQAAEMSALHEGAQDNLARLTPLLDEAIERLGREDRNALVLRFFEQREFASVGKTLGVTEEAARKRVGRALGRLGAILKERGVTLSAGALTTLLGAEAVSAAPVGLAASVTGAALAGTAAGGGTVFTFFKIMTLAKLKFCAVGALAVAGVVTPLVMQHQELALLRGENQSLRRQLEQVQQKATEGEQVSKAGAPPSPAQPPDSEQFRELLRLRGEVGPLRAAAKELEQLKKATARSPGEEGEQGTLQQKDREAKLKQLLQARPNLTIPEFYLLSDRELAEIAKDSDLETEDGIRATFSTLRFKAMNQFAILMQPALKHYIARNNGQPPADVLQLAPDFDPPADAAVLQRYKVLYSDSNHIMGGWNGGWAITQKELVEATDLPWFISPVGFSPGHSGSSAQ